MVRVSRFSSDDPGWIDPDDRLSQRLEADDTDWDDLNPDRSRRRTRRRPRRERAARERRRDPRQLPVSESETAAPDHQPRRHE